MAYHLTSLVHFSHYTQGGFKAVWMDWTASVTHLKQTNGLEYSWNWRAQIVYKSHSIFSLSLVFNVSPSNNSHIYASIIKPDCLYTYYCLNIISRSVPGPIEMRLQITLFLAAALQVTALVTPRAKDPARKQEYIDRPGTLQVSD